jgi:hypothetical protein
MGHTKEVGIHMTEYASQTSLHPTKSMKSSYEEDLPRAPWPSQPVRLKETPVSKWVNIAYDVALCGAPLLLLTKVGLVFHSADVEKNIRDTYGPVNTVAAAPNKLTSGLIDFNSQVRFISRDPYAPS